MDYETSQELLEFNRSDRKDNKRRREAEHRRQKALDDNARRVYNRDMDFEGEGG